jgi:hypothetical protein
LEFGKPAFDTSHELQTVLMSLTGTCPENDRRGCGACEMFLSFGSHCEAGRC